LYPSMWTLNVVLPLLYPSLVFQLHPARRPSPGTSAANRDAGPISFETTPAGIFPGQRSTSGTRKAPSQLVFFSLRKDVHLLRTSSLACSPLPRWGEGSQFQRLWRDEANQAEGHDSIRPEEAALRFTWRRPRAASPWTYFTPPPTAFDIAASCCRALSSASSMLKLAGFCLGGNSLNVLRNSPTMAWAGTSRNVRSAIHLP
jgi:hypothetical protein